MGRNGLACPCSLGHRHKHIVQSSCLYSVNLVDWFDERVEETVSEDHGGHTGVELMLRVSLHVGAPSQIGWRTGGYPFNDGRQWQFAPLSTDTNV